MMIKTIELLKLYLLYVPNSVMCKNNLSIFCLKLWIQIACARLSVREDEQKKWASSEIANEQKMAGREKERADKHLFKYLNPPTSKPTSCDHFKMSQVQ